MNQPTVKSVNFVYIEKPETYAAILAISSVNSINGMKYIVLELGKEKTRPYTKAKEIAEELGVPFIDDTEIKAKGEM